MYHHSARRSIKVLKLFNLVVSNLRAESFKCVKKCLNLISKCLTVGDGKTRIWIQLQKAMMSLNK